MKSPAEEPPLTYPDATVDAPAEEREATGAATEPSLRFEGFAGATFPGSEEARSRADDARRVLRVRVLERTCAELERALAERTREVAEAKERLGVVAREAVHRFGNLIATISAVARRTALGQASVAVFVVALTGRLSSMDIAYRKVMTDQGPDAADLGRIIETQLEIYRESYPGQIELAGPPMPIRSDAARMIGLAIHELATNAVKHGALAVPGGHVRVTWSVTRRQGADALDFCWSERAADTAARPAPSRPGFGTHLLCRAAPALLRGKASLDLSSGGLLYRLEAPLP